jgi:nickel transport protein
MVVPMISKSIVMRLLLVFLSTITTTASAHKVNLFAYVEGDQIYVQGYFSDGHKAKNSEVTVFSVEGDKQELLKGKTNEDGDFTFPVQGKKSLRIVLNAGQGHQADYLMPVEEVIGTVATTNFKDSISDARQSPPPSETFTQGNGGTFLASESMMRKAVAQGVLPLAREISELKERRGFSDIVGGVGFIVGLLGILAYIRARQELRKGRELNS